MLVFGQGAMHFWADFRVSSLIRRVREIETIFVFSLVAILREFQALAVNFKQFIKSILKWIPHNDILTPNLFFLMHY